MKFKTMTIMSALGLGLLGQAAWAGNITGINVSALPNNQKVIKIQFDRDVTAPSGFITPSPARIALDFANTGLQLPQSVLEYNDPLLKQIAAAQSADRSRLMLSLAQPGEYKTEIKGNEVWVYVQESTAAPAAAPAVVRTPPVAAVTEVRTETVYTPAPKSTSAANTPIGVDFRKGANNSGLVEINIGNYSGQPEIKRQADRLMITYKNAPLPTEQQRDLDVTDFSTPVRTIALRRLGNDTQLTIRMQGNWTFRPSGSGSRQTIEISPQVDMASSGLKPQQKSFAGKRVSLDFQDVEVRTILQILAKESGMNIVASDSVQGKMTISLKDVPWDQALDLVMQARNLDMRKQGNIINIAPREELLNKDKATLQAQNEIENLGPLVSQTFQLKYKSAEEFRKVLNISDNNSNSNDRNSILTARGSALIDPATNTLIITDTPNIIQKFEKLVAQLDVPSQQVMVEARIVEAQDGFSRELGVRFGGGYRNVNGTNSTTVGGLASGALGSFGDSRFGIPNVNLPVSSPTSALSLIRSTASGALGLELQAMQEENRGKIISSPRVLTQDRKEAVIESGKEVPYQEASSSGATTTSFKKAVLGLTVTPQITPDGNVIMDVVVKKDSVDLSCSAYAPCINTKNLNTRAMVEDGGTLILGGIYEEDNSNIDRKVPLLGDIPVLGNLFKYQKRNQRRNELLIFITPRIMGNAGSNLRY
ncbi:type IV pilus secretin PilQ [Paralysiella testudinis]|uniref:Type IV pilus biogenesis and competence protein PilQ n=1 Tax=Paralysiella testudinis TaxID=2809020 RepID=A0A892ZN27_9NEIS|nr:type IV pilus secretin PilQ [Paralysiella testudinis]QRQ83157.1 type IV pilus secretin PilQ [Paralysiella testudinis]